MQVGRAVLSISLGLSAFAVSDPTSAALPLTPGNILVNNAPNNMQDLFEYTPTGVLVQSIPVIPPDGGRDLAIDRDGRVQIYDSGALTTIDLIADINQSRSFAGLSLVNNTTYGGIGALGRYVFLVDQQTAHDGAAKGVVRFDNEGGRTQRFATDIEPFDLTVGLDGLLYTLSKGTAPNGGGNRIHVFDPITMEPIRMLNLPEEHRGIAVDANGHIYTAQRNSVSRVNHYDPDGFRLDFINDPGIFGFGDIDINRAGQLVISSHGGSLAVTTTALNSIITFPTRVSSGTNFATWIEAPIPELPLGDFDGNGLIDAADLSAWAAGFGATEGVSKSRGDADDDGDVDGDDFLVWQRQLVATSSTVRSNAVPEPTFSAAIVGVTVFGLRKRRARRHGNLGSRSPAWRLR